MTIKPFLSDNISLFDVLLNEIKDMDILYNYLPNYETTGFKLAYIRTKGYILIKTGNNNNWFKSFKSVNDPKYFYNFYHTEEFEGIRNTIKGYLKEYIYFLKNEANKKEFEINEIIKDTIEDIIDSLGISLKEKYENNIHEKLINHNSNDIKELLSNPIETFNKYTTKDKQELILSNSEATNRKKELNKLIEDTIYYINDLATYQTEEEKPIINNYEIQDKIIKLISDTNPKENYKEYYQTYLGIYKIEKNNTHKLIARCNILNAVKILDPLGIKEPVYNLSIDNFTIKKKEEFLYLTSEELIEALTKAKVFFNTPDIEKFINAYFIEGCINFNIPVIERIYKEGYFIINNKVVENTNIKNLKYTSLDVYDAITLLNEIISSRTLEGRLNDSTVYRFMLYAPFSYCLKQIGFKIAAYSLILIGKSKANKTGAFNIGNLFYKNPEKENTASTLSYLGSLMASNTLPKAIDEAYSLLINNPLDMQDFMKKNIDNLVTRITKDRTNLNDNLKYEALGLAVYIMNERTEFKDFITERYKIIDYSNQSHLTKEERKEFNKKYVPESEETILNKLCFIGCEYKKKMIKLIENKDPVLFDPEETTINILKEIAEETTKATNKPIDFIEEMYIIKDSSENYNYDVKEAIRDLLNTEFKTLNRIAFNKSIEAMTFINSISRNDFNFITWNKYRTQATQDKEFIINGGKLVKYINNGLEGVTVELIEIIEALNLKEILENKAKKENKSFNDFIKTQHKIKVKENNKERIKNITGFYLNLNELANNLFSIEIDLIENIDYSEDKEIIEAS